MKMESYKHKFAKETLAGWFREISDLDEYVGLSPIRWRVNRGGPNFGVWTEYPICLNNKNDIVGRSAWDEEHFYSWMPEGVEFNDRPPTYDETIKLGLLPIAILDVAIQHKGYIVYGIEVVHRNDVSKIKFEYLNRIGIPIYRVDADWVLSRVKRPDELECIRVI